MPKLKSISAVKNMEVNLRTQDHFSFKIVFNFPCRKHFLHGGSLSLWSHIEN